MKTDVFQESATAVAKRFGVSAKALRVYERKGLIKPPRTMAGWRIYRREELELIATIVALRQLGLSPHWPPAQGRRRSGRVLALQEAALEDAKADVEEALALVCAAWAAVFADIDALGDKTDPTSAQALAIGRRAQALLAEFTRGAIQCSTRLRAR